MQFLIRDAKRGNIRDVTMQLQHAFSYRPWQRDIALLAMTRVIVKGARESVSDR